MKQEHLKGHSMKTLEQLRSELKSSVAAIDKFLAGIVGEGGKERGMTEEEVSALEGLSEATERLERQISALERSHRASAGRATPADGGTVPAGVKDDRPFKTFGEQLQAIMSDGMNKGADRDPRLIWEMSAGANETVPSEGGFLVQQDFADTLFNRMREQADILPRTTELTLTGRANSIKLPFVDETSRARGARFGGMQAFWTEEGGTAASTQPKIGAIEMSLNKLMGISYITEEMMADAGLMEQLITMGMVDVLTFETEDSIVNGNGAGKPLGFLNSGALISVAAQSGQATGTIVTQNIIDMWDRLPARSRRNAVWLCADSGVEAQLQVLTMVGSNAHLYRLPGMNAAVAGNEDFGLLVGKPVIPVEYLPAIGTVGDLCLVDMSEYLTLTKGGMKQAESMHVRFLYDEHVLRVTHRIDGQPAWKQPVLTANGATTKSPFIAIAAR
jgi:HK97 family phage major capsid protein